MKFEDFEEGACYLIQAPDEYDKGCPSWQEEMDQQVEGAIIQYFHLTKPAQRSVIRKENTILYLSDPARRTVADPDLGLSDSIVVSMWNIDLAWLTKVEVDAQGNVLAPDVDPQEHTAQANYLGNFVEYPDVEGFMRVVEEAQASTSDEWTADHYDFTCKIPVTEADAVLGHVSFKLDPYFVSHNWKLGSKDESGALWHIFKTCARFGVKNTIEREIKAIHGQVKRMAQIYNVDLEK